MRSYNDYVAVIVPLRVDVCPVLWKHLVYGTVCVALCVCQLCVFVSVCECVCECESPGIWVVGTFRMCMCLMFISFVVGGMCYTGFQMCRAMMMNIYSTRLTLRFLMVNYLTLKHR